MAIDPGNQIPDMFLGTAAPEAGKDVCNAERTGRQCFFDPLCTEKVSPKPEDPSMAGAASRAAGSAFPGRSFACLPVLLSRW